ncbi:DUF2274 domain-containing protein [Roseomonas eburnea]|uniref:DUF2274 domain-containing protein n=1 Tax=Neoroseomonas eburnea TaxID=1346889 RepID=A0A9X9XGR1_9PROT|nr:DUF2274 domain-containing protein [Neoroseomonas eburnea]MBR0682897.1 DUF2274 domain-containing protein [Neoroseomonas eburnea]
MPKLKLGPILDDRPVKLTVELPAELHRDLVAYADALSRETGQQVEPTKLVAPMLARFLASDRGFRSARRSARPTLARQRQSAPLPREDGS